MPNSGFPSRVIDVGTASEKMLRLVCEKATSPREKFVALSHCWGMSDKFQFVLTTENEGNLREAIPFDALPRTFRDAIRLCRRIGVRYLWIDSLCIIQNDSQDWARESVRMHCIYRDAYLTIIAARAKSDTQGFLRFRTESPDFQPVTTLNMYNLQGKKIRVAAHILRRDLLWSRSLYKNGIGYVGDNQPISERAWVIQERFLSRRKVLFCHDQIFWECQTVTASEDGLNYSTTAFQVEKLWTALTGYTNWYKLISEYTFCSLTYETDVFAALTGLTNCILSSRAAPAPSCCAGLWTDDIARGLAWKLKCHRTTMFQDKCSAVCKEAQSFREKTYQYQAPTFSWAAWRSGIAYDYAANVDVGTRNPVMEPLVHYVKHSLQRVDSATALAGPYSGGWLHLRGSLFPILSLTPTTATTSRYKLLAPTTDHEVQNSMEVLCSSDDNQFTVFGAFDDLAQKSTNLRSKTYILPLLRDERNRIRYLTFLILQKKGRSKNPMHLVRLGIGRSRVETVPPSQVVLGRPRSLTRTFSEALAYDGEELAQKKARLNDSEAVAVNSQSTMDLWDGASVTDFYLV